MHSKRKLSNDLKQRGKSNLIPEKGDSGAKKSFKSRLDRNFPSIRGHVVPGCGQIHKKGSDTEKSDEEGKKNKSSKWRTSNLLQIKDDKNNLMEKFESSLKERLLSSTHFTKQVPLLDNITKEKVRMKTLIEDEDLTRSESMYNSVFPARKETVKSSQSFTLKDEVFTKHSIESSDWLKNLETDIELNEINKSFLEKEKEAIALRTPPSRLKSSQKNESKKNKDLSKLSEIGSRDSVKETKVSSEQNNDKVIKDIKIREKNRISLDQSNISKTPNASKLTFSVTNDKIARNKINENSVDASKSETISKKSTLPQSQSTLNRLSSLDFNNSALDKLNDVIYIEKEMSEKESFEIYGGKVYTTKIEKNISIDDNRSGNLTMNENLSFSQGIMRGGPQYEAVEVAQWDTYNVTFVETSKEESVVNEEPSELNNQASQITVGNDISDIKEEGDNKEEESIPLKEEEGKEEDCTEDPCNEPSWFEEYGIDKKQRKLAGDTKIDLGSTSSSEQEFETFDARESVEVAEILPDLTAKKKKKVKKRVSKVSKSSVEYVEADQAQEEPEGPELKAIREIKTVPLVCLEEISQPELEKPPSTGLMPMEYLQTYVGKHLVAGLAQVALYMPEDPVEYLAHWLIRERKKETLLDEMKQFKAEAKQFRNKNIIEMRKKAQIDYLKEETNQKYQEGKDEPLYPTFDTSESDFDGKSFDIAEQTAEEEIDYID